MRSFANLKDFHSAQMKASLRCQSHRTSRRVRILFWLTLYRTMGSHMIQQSLTEERERARYAYNSRYQAIGRIGLPAVRDHRRKRLDAEHQARMATIDDAEAIVPDLNAVMMLRVGELLSINKDGLGVRGV